MYCLRFYDGLLTVVEMGDSCRGYTVPYGEAHDMGWVSGFSIVVWRWSGGVLCA